MVQLNQAALIQTGNVFFDIRFPFPSFGSNKRVFPLGSQKYVLPPFDGGVLVTLIAGSFLLESSFSQSILVFFSLRQLLKPIEHSTRLRKSYEK